MTPPPVRPASRLFTDLVSGRRRGFGASLARAGLWLASLPYGLAVRLRNALYSRGWKQIHRADVPVISVGNLTVGGTGKTPCVEFVATFFNDRDCRVCILSRGYGAESGPNDEALVLEENLPDVPHLQGADRVELARTAAVELETQLLVLDDGFQHRRLARDLDLVLLDATCPWGHGHLLPRGLLREPISSLRRAHAILLTRCDLVSPTELDVLRSQVAKIAPEVPVVETVHRPLALVDANGDTRDPQSLRDASVAAFCGIGNPDGFRRTLAALGCRTIDFRDYPDHHAYTRNDVDDLRRWADSLPPETTLLCTQKDLVKLRLTDLEGRPLWALRIGLDVLRGGDRLTSLFSEIHLGRMKDEG